jgi:hypothetical protein
MKTMIRALVITLAVISASSHAFAERAGSDQRTEAQKDKERAEAARDSQTGHTNSAARGAQVAGKILEVAGLSNTMTPDVKDRLTAKILVDSTMRVEAIKLAKLVKSDAKNADIYQAQLESLIYADRANLSKDDTAMSALSEIVRAEHSYDFLALNALADATSWSDKSRSSPLELVKRANAKLADGKITSRGQALIDAEADMKKDKILDEKFNLDDIFKSCKK